MVTRALLFLISLALFSGCAQTANRYNSSAVDYLYPDRYEVVEMSDIPHLQLPITDEGMASITYWTLVGAYFVPGEKNATLTMVDAAVYDIKSRALLFRAPGVSYVKSKATPVNLSEQLRLDRVNAFDLAANDLIANLENQLDRFKEKIKQRPEEIRVTQRAGYSGGGFTAFIFMLTGGMGLWISYRGVR